LRPFILNDWQLKNLKDVALGIKKNEQVMLNFDNRKIFKDAYKVILNNLLLHSSTIE